MENPSILVIEGDPEIRKLLRNALSADQYLLREAVTAGNGLAQWMATKPDLVLLDPVMPDMDGIEVIRYIRWQKNYCPIIVLSAQTDETHMIAALDAGADDFMAKPFGPGELLA